ncbi:MAG: energy transducer TonB [Deltaproteobacteria bacterium]|nr:energy transducer TonB [Deltaproteobacteria bacterium]MBW1987196.1 energy transducer TonB [Deltaproteobacteria bacterium]MBW2135058.1 energy transducer TonB [Deltaproteobacteria bacterium]
MASLRFGNSRPGLLDWTIPVLMSFILHGMILGGALLFYQDRPRPKRVVVVEPITLTCARPGPAAGGGSSPPPQVKPKPQPKPKVVPRRPKPRSTVRRRPRREPVPPPPSLAMARPEVPAPKNLPTYAARSTGQGPTSQRGYGRGSGGGCGRGSGSGSGARSGFGSGSILSNYLSGVRQLLQRHKNYPSMARRQRLEGVVVLRFTIAASGQIKSKSILRSSGHPVLDQAAQDTVRRVGRFPPLPVALQKSQLTIEVPLAFRLVGS